MLSAKQSSHFNNLNPNNLSQTWPVANLANTLQVCPAAYLLPDSRYQQANNVDNCSCNPEKLSMIFINGLQRLWKKKREKTEISNIGAV